MTNDILIPVLNRERFAIAEAKYKFDAEAFEDWYKAYIALTGRTSATALRTYDAEDIVNLVFTTPDWSELVSHYRLTPGIVTIAIADVEKCWDMVPKEKVGDWNEALLD